MTDEFHQLRALIEQGYEQMKPDKTASVIMDQGWHPPLTLVTLYRQLLPLCGWQDGAEVDAAGSMDNDMAAERADAIVEFVRLARRHSLPNHLLPGHLEKVECPVNTCAYSFIPPDAAGQLCAHYVAVHSQSTRPLTIAELQEEIGKFSYRDGWKLSVYEHEFDGPYLLIVAPVPNSYRQGETIDLGIRSPIPPQADADAFARWLLWRLRLIEAHECREMLRRDGTLISDPHATDAPA